jgi:hypothetical protein
MFNRILILGLLVAIASCSSSQKENEPRDFEGPTFQLMDASSKALPRWIDAPVEGDVAKERDKHRYFISESSHVNKRLCTRSAEARATTKIAQEVAQFIKNSYAEATQGSSDDDVSEYMQEQLAQETQSFLVGAGVIQNYWEQRRYKVELGAEEDAVKFQCYALVRISKKSLTKAMAAARAKLLNNVQNTEVKAKTEQIIEEAEKAFVNKV